ncbi:hypothetical protein QP579_07940, partial [Actinomycetaceae bacterium UMB8041B]|nr:hypothetical protein [Actinomycetaceae bacterium UMB8041B]
DVAYYLDKRQRGADVAIYLLGADHHASNQSHLWDEVAPAHGSDSALKTGDPIATRAFYWVIDLFH